ncbi:hypothetical protein [Pseudoxanthomonas mexicana]|uniref:hypothetical protein n=1 Tax=Pseudoxanthomonas mexicana TaxID=128785 RepID=UPI0028A945F5|nr:hypothetical protein [Pseudoxanthomonas mexicana]
MAEKPSIEEMITKYLLACIDATGTLYQKELYGHLLVVIYSSIDTLGLLDAPPDQVSASGASFKSWVQNYLVPQPSVEFNEIDLWAARCAVLHTFTTQSDLSRAGKAREIQYYGGDKTTPQAKRFVSITKAMDGGRHLPVHFEDFYGAFLQALRLFVPDLDAKCSADPKCEKRLREVLQIFPMQDVL